MLISVILGSGTVGLVGGDNVGLCAIVGDGPDCIEI